jgi:subtilisin family serine protease
MIFGANKDRSIWPRARPAAVGPVRPAPARRPALESLEDRVLLTAPAGPAPAASAQVSGVSADSATIRGVVFQDPTGSGEYVTGDPGVPGVTVYLDLRRDGKLDPGDPRTVTAADGSFSFLHLAPGSYTVSQVVPPGWEPTSYVIAATATASSPADQLIGLDRFQSDPRFTGINGQGESVVVLDTGIDAGDSAFGPANGQGVGSAVVYQHDFTTGAATATDTDGHGTYVASVIASRDPDYPGIAPGVNVIALKVLDSAGDGKFGAIDQALRWVEANAAKYNIVCVNMSFGDGGNYTTPQSLYGIGPDLAALAAENVTVVAAAGNGYQPGDSQPGLAYPAVDPNVIPVGAVWDANDGGPWVWANGARDNTTGADHIVSFSQRLPGSGEVFAPGTLITGAYLGGGTAQLSGTSTAAAVVSGVVVLIQELAQRTLGHLLSPAQIRDLLNSTGAVLRDGQSEDDNVAHTEALFHRIDVYAMAGAVAAMGSVSVAQAGGSRAVTLAAGGTATVYLGAFHLGALSGQVFADANGNGRLDAGDKPLAGRVVYVDLNGDGRFDAGDPSTVTNAQGRFTLNGLPPGATTVRLVLLAGERQTTPVLSVTVSSGLDWTGAALGVYTQPQPPAPVLTGDGKTDSIPEGSTNPVGQTVASLLGSTVRGGNAQGNNGIAVIGVNTGAQGQWQYSLDAGRTWANLGMVSLADARLLGDNTRLRFVPAANWYGTALFYYRAWGGAGGQPGWLVDLSGKGATGGTTAYSSNQAVGRVVVTYVHHAPVLAGPGWLPPEPPNTVNLGGVTVSAVLAGTLASLAPGGSPGMAVVGVSGLGTWQYSLNGGRSWVSLAAASFAHAFLLPSTALVRFLPAKGWKGTAGLTYRAWDETTGTAGSVRDLTSWSLVGGTTAFSKEIQTAALAGGPGGPSLADG